MNLEKAISFSDIDKLGLELNEFEGSIFAFIENITKYMLQDKEIKLKYCQVFSFIIDSFYKFVKINNSDFIKDPKFLQVLEKIYAHLNLLVGKDNRKFLKS